MYVYIFLEAAKHNFPTNQKSDLIVANAVKEWLKHGPTRIKLK
jgi:trans-aconitate methyltransferase